MSKSSFTERLTLGRTGDAGALADLFARWRPLLRLQAHRLLGADLAARVDPSDVVQEACTQAFRDLGRFRGQTEGEWVAWLRRIVAGQAAKTRRRHHAGKRAAGWDSPLTGAETVAQGASPLDEAMDREHAARLAAAVEALPEAMRDVVVRRVFYQEPFDVVARAVGRSPGAARVLWTRALRCLRETLAPPTP